MRSVLASPYRGISSRCSASALRSRRGKPRHRRRDPRTLAASAGRLRRKSCCSCSRWSRRASVRQLGNQPAVDTMSAGPQTTVVNRKLFTKVLFFFSFSFFFTRAFLQEAVVGLFKAAVALRAPVGWSVALSGSLHGAIGAGGRAFSPGRPLGPVSVH